MIVLACPGQGSQTPGFLTPWFDSDPSNRDLIEALGTSIDVDLVAHGTTSDQDTIRDTAVAQPLIVAASLMSYRALRSALGDDRASFGGVAGHSVGEIAAAAIAGILSDHEAMRFVRIRSAEMAAAASASPTGMSAVIGGGEDELLGKLDLLGLSPANFNGGGQIVVAGKLDALASLQADPPSGARVIPLQVAGAFHTAVMERAIAPLELVAAELDPQDPSIPIWTNADGSRVTSGSEFVRLLVRQISSPVRWDLCMASLADAGVTGIIELTPAGALAGLAKRSLKGIPVVAIKTPDDLAAAVDLVRGDS